MEIEKKYNQYFSGNNHLEVSFDSIDRQILKHIKINGIKLKYKDKVVVNISELYISAGFPSVFKAANGIFSSDLTVSLIHPELCINQEFYDFIHKEKKISTDSSDLMHFLSSLSVNLAISDMSLDLNYAGNSLKSDGNINFNAKIQNNFNLTSISGNISAIGGYLKKFESEVFLDELVFSSNFKHEIKINLSEFVIEKLIKINSLSSTLKISDGIISGQAFDKYCAFAYDLANCSCDDLDLTFELSLLKTDNKFANFSFDIGGTNYAYDNIRGSASNITGNTAIDFSSKQVDISLAFKAANINNLPIMEIESASLQNSIFNLNYGQNENNSINFSSFILGKSKNVAIGDFATNFSFSTDFKSLDNLKSIENYSNSELDITDSYISAFPGENNLKVKFSGQEQFDVKLDFDNKLSANASFMYKTKKTDLRVFFRDFKINKVFLDNPNFPQDIRRYVTDDTSVNGSLFVNGVLDPDDMEGRLSLNMALKDVLLANSNKIIAASVEATSLHSFVNINSLAITCMGMRLSYNGTYDLKTNYPQGNLILQNAKTGSKLSDFSFKLDDDMQGYKLFGSLEKYPDYGFSAHVSWKDGSSIQGLGNISTKYNKFDVNFVSDINDNSLVCRIGDSVATFTTDENGSKVSAKLDNFGVNFSENVKVVLNSEILGNVHSDTGQFDFDCDYFKLKFSELLSFAFSAHLDQNSFNLDNLSIESPGEKIDFEGFADFEYNSISELLKGDSSSLVSTVNLKKKGTEDVIFGKIKSDNYSIDISFDSGLPFVSSVLGARHNGFFANFKIGDITFESRYRDKVINFYNGKGSFGNLGFDEFSIYLDFINKKLAGRIIADNVRQHLKGDVRQGGIIDISADLNSIWYGFLALVGVDIHSKVDFSFRNFHLGGGFDLKDNNVSLVLSKNDVALQGDLINGTYSFKSKLFDIDINKDLLFGVHAYGSFDKDIDVMFKDIYAPIGIVDQFVDVPFYNTNAGIIEGDLLVVGPRKDPSFYGTLYAQNFQMDLFYIPDQVLSVKDMVFVASDHDIVLDNTPVLGTGLADGRYFDAFMKLHMSFKHLSLDTFNLSLDIFKDPIDFWLPLKANNNMALPVNVRGDVKGKLDFWVVNGEFGLDGDIVADETSISFSIDKLPDWYYKLNFICSANIKLTTGKNVEFIFPDKDKPFISFTVDKDESISLKYSRVTKKASASGDVRIKSGRISYINNDFNITDGRFVLSKSLKDEKIDFRVDMTAKIREYDAKGQRVDIFLILKNSTLTNLNPRFESMPIHTENEILNILGQSVLPSSGENISVSGIANAAVVARNAIADLGIINDYSEYTLNNVVRDALNLDVLTIRSPLIQNILISAIPGSTTNNNLLAKYLDGTTVFTGKYLSKNIFARSTMLLKMSNGKNRFKYGHFLTDDLNLDFEFSIDWDNPIGNFSIFTHPQELSVLDFLDTIGIGYSKRFKF